MLHIVDHKTGRGTITHIAFANSEAELDRWFADLCRTYPPAGYDTRSLGKTFMPGGEVRLSVSRLKRCDGKAVA